MTKYGDLTLEQLSKHAAEGWELANKRTEQLRQAVEALRGAEFVIQCWARGRGEDYTGNINLKEMQAVLKWGKQMFPEPTDDPDYWVKLAEGKI